MRWFVHQSLPAPRGLLPPCLGSHPSAPQGPVWPPIQEAEADLSRILGLVEISRSQQQDALHPGTVGHTVQRQVISVHCQYCVNRISVCFQGYLAVLVHLFWCFVFLQYPSHSDSSLATGSSEGSLQTTVEEGLSFSVSPPQDLDLPLPSHSPCSRDGSGSPHYQDTLTPHNTGTATSVMFNLQATRGHQRSQSSCGGSTSPGCQREDSMDPSDEDLGIVIGGCSNSEQLSETLSSLSLSSLLCSSSLLPPVVKKSNSTGSLDQGNLAGRGKDARPQGYTSNPWSDQRIGRVEVEGGQSDVSELEGKSTSQITVVASKKNR